MLPPWVSTLRVLCQIWGSKKLVAREVGIRPDRLSMLLKGHVKHVRAGTDAKMAKAVDSLARKTPPVVKTTATSRIWQSMRIMRRFGVVDLMLTAAASRDMVVRMLGILTKASYLRMTSRHTAGQPAQYSLVRNTGPQAPVLKEGRRGFFDPNLNQEVVFDG